MIIVIFGTTLLATAFTSLAPSLIIPACSLRLPTINPVTSCKKNGIFFWLQFRINGRPCRRCRYRSLHPIAFRLFYFLRSASGWQLCQRPSHRFAHNRKEWFCHNLFELSKPRPFCICIVSIYNTIDDIEHVVRFSVAYAHNPVNPERIFCRSSRVNAVKPGLWLVAQLADDLLISSKHSCSVLNL